VNFAGNRCIPAKWRFDRIRPAFPPWREAVTVGVTAGRKQHDCNARKKSMRRGHDPAGALGAWRGAVQAPWEINHGSQRSLRAAHARGGGIVSRGRCDGTTENEFNGIGGLPTYIRIVPVRGTFRTGERTFQCKRSMPLPALWAQ
jgi:hypothetical protein